MSTSRALRDSMFKKGGNLCRSYHADGDQPDHWMQDIHPKKGALHQMLDVPQGNKIPTSLEEDANHSKSPLLRKRANLALRYKGL